MPERTKDRRWWFGRFKSQELGNFRGSVRKHPCCECAQPSDPVTGKITSYKGIDGTHCKCGKDAWVSAMEEERSEYENRTAALAAQAYLRRVQSRPRGSAREAFRPLAAAAA